MPNSKIDAYSYWTNSAPHDDETHFWIQCIYYDTLAKFLKIPLAQMIQTVIDAIVYLGFFN